MRYLISLIAVFSLSGCASDIEYIKYRMEHGYAPGEYEALTGNQKLCVASPVGNMAVIHCH